MQRSKEEETENGRRRQSEKGSAMEGPAREEKKWKSQREAGRTSNSTTERGRESQTAPVAKGKRGKGGRESLN